ncbi:DUF1003 domain-containing protein [Oscillochloris sp. ZM17-4]|uniref:DUF1003 domain-containing protein n=1 Tax=Oscillochloris sp. ZM17-4 TaxID=2866714 RepID=UPI001C72E0F4|nr:DUF1003 domain-containing protein [Oscillochloris sp. ZM17-4]MBX0330123.1 DUF1003 domain-containing protein [Oscillochloris sp. ZM17-4]
MESDDRVRCQACGKEKRLAEVVPAGAVREELLRRLRAGRPAWDEGGYICAEDLAAARADYVAQLVADEGGDLSELEREVVASISDGDLIAEDTNETFAQQLSFGDRLSDRIAAFGGSWSFISIFGAIIIVWIGANSLLTRFFDPYPFILLNLVLSCVAAMQAPIIMMSQNRQEEKDRLRASHDYQVNLKAELEIRQMQEKLDHLMNQQWQRLASIQEVQVDMLNELVRAGRLRDGA